MVNYAFAFSQSELGKYFEWIIMQIELSLHNVSFLNEGKSLQYNVRKTTANVTKKCDFQIIP